MIYERMIEQQKYLPEDKRGAPNKKSDDKQTTK
jgi:hypothetical protein